MAINFPNTPSAGDPHSEGGVNWLYDGEKWVSQTTDEASLWTRDVATDTLTPTNSGDNVQIASLNGGPLAGFRNQIINGDFRVWQRNNRAQTLTAEDFVADRWGVNFTGTSVFCDQEVVGGDVRLAVTTVATEARLEQNIEAQSCAKLINKQVTFSFYTTCVNPKVNIDVRNGSNTAASITSGWATPTNVGGNRWTWTGTVTTSDGKIGSSLTGRGIEITISFDDQGTALPNAKYQFWNIQLEPGPVATPFEMRPIGTELALCQRYYQQFTGVVSCDVTSGQLYGGAINFATPMRTSPDVEPNNIEWDTLFSAGSPVVENRFPTGFRYFKAASGNGAGRFQWTSFADAEL